MLSAVCQLSKFIQRNLETHVDPKMHELAKP